jgi:hypothetical protein
MDMLTPVWKICLACGLRVDRLESPTSTYLYSTCSTILIRDQEERIGIQVNLQHG